MNYLSHYVFNHHVSGMPEQPYFAIGVVLPDLWLRFSRRRRIRWVAVRTAVPDDQISANLRAGLLNHIEVDRRFHTLPTFLTWQKDVRAAADGQVDSAALLDFLAHMAVELALDHALLRRRPELVDQFYDVVSQCDPCDVARRVGLLGDVDTAGLDEVLSQFFERRFLRHYRTFDGLVDIVRIVLSLANIPAPPDALIGGLVVRALELAAPDQVWHELADGQTTLPAPAGTLA